MSKEGTSKASAASALPNVPECPVCLEFFIAPIYQCKSGHSICSRCTKNLLPPLCPQCRQDMTQIRNLMLEEMISKIKVPCPNKALGCIFTITPDEKSEHEKECIFRKMECPIGTVFGKCSWSGQLKQLMEHFKERHADSCNVNSDNDVEIDNIKPNENERYLFLSSQNKFIFMVTLKIDALQNMAYWVIQHIGSKNAAQQYSYEIHVASKQSNKRKYVYTDSCFNDAMKADEVIRLGKCAMIPMPALKHFMKNNKLSFKFIIKRLGPPQSKKHENKDQGNKTNGSSDTKNPFKKSNSGPKGKNPHFNKNKN